MIHTPTDIEHMVIEFGFLPFFRCGINGFSIEDVTPEELWFSDELDGPWEWKGPIISMGSVAYGKFFSGKAGFVSLEWLPDFINYRRSLVPMSRMSDEKRLYDEIVAHESLLSTELKRICGFTASRNVRLNPIEKIALAGVEHTSEASRLKSSFEKLITRLQMSTYVVTADFEYNYTKQGKPYGWGKARYTTPELMYGEELSMVERTPEESFRRILCHLNEHLPDAPETVLKKIIGF